MRCSRGSVLVDRRPRRHCGSVSIAPSNNWSPRPAPRFRSTWRAWAVICSTASRASRRAAASSRSISSRPTRSPPTPSRRRPRRHMRLDGQGLLVLVDPVRTSGAEAARIGRAAKAAGVRGLLIGSSFDGAAQTHEVARALRDNAPGIPVALFPGSAMQLTDQVDLVLFLSLVSGRNPQYLIEEHVRAVPYLQQHPVPTLSTAYILIDGGRVTSVESVSQTRPLPADKPELAAAHAMAARLIGMQAVYLEAGSGAERPVPPEVIRACRAAVPQRPLFVGGGIRTPAQARAARYETTLRGGGTLFFAGNGGSAADAQHVATEYVVRYQTNRPAMRAVALTTDTSLLTACANDMGFDEVFSRQVEALAEPGDLLVLHSTSGES